MCNSKIRISEGILDFILEEIAKQLHNWSDQFLEEIIQKEWNLPVR